MLWADLLPPALQLLGHSFGEHTLIKYRYACEWATHHRKVPARFHILSR